MQKSSSTLLLNPRPWNPTRATSLCVGTPAATAAAPPARQRDGARYAMHFVDAPLSSTTLSLQRHLYLTSE